MLSVMPSVASTDFVWSIRIGTLFGVLSPARSTMTGNGNPSTLSSPPEYARIENRRALPLAALMLIVDAMLIGFMLAPPDLRAGRVVLT